ncbi:MAG: ATP-binding protein [Candidatus Melainabacteria bacterium]|nr:ATP-binding protein [Candidatus Melainabacteria bacterium]
MLLIERKKEIKKIKEKLSYSPALAILGPRQCGKTTLAREFEKTLNPKKVYFFDLENPTDLKLFENPYLLLADLKGYVFIDEVQRKPDLFPVLRVLIDKNESVTKFILLGSASPELLSRSSESLAGRISYLELGGLSLDILDINDTRKLWLRGGFPRSFLAKNDEASFAWREDFISTFLERDIPSLGIKIGTNALRRFWTMLAHYHGQIYNSSEIAKSLGVSDTTARHYLDILVNTFVIRELSPWYSNTKKRLVKRPKIYFRDSGLFHSLSQIPTFKQLYNHPQMGSSWENFVIEQCISFLDLKANSVFFWGIHAQAELDLLYFKDTKAYGIEVKFNEAPSVTKSMQLALEELNLEKLYIIYPGDRLAELDKKIILLPFKNFQTLCQKF